MNSGCATTIRNGYNQPEKFGAIADIWAKRLAAVIDAIDSTRTLAAAFGAMYGPLTCYTNPRSLALGKPEQRMTFKMKILFSIMSSLLFVVPSEAAEFTYQEYTKTPEVWKRGFVFGISRICLPWRSPTKRLPIR